METIIEYRNDFDLPIDAQQLKQFKQYRKLYFYNGNLIKEEEFEDGKVQEGIYYLLSGQNYKDILDDIDAAITWSIRSNRQIINGYDVWESRFYEKGELSDIYHLNVLISGKVIASRSFWPDGTPMPGSTYKIVYLSELFKVESDSHYSFYFDKEGNIELIMPYTEGRDRPYERLSRFLEDDMLATDFTPAQLQYFTNEEPLVPLEKLF